MTDRVFIGLGSNTGDRLANLTAALHAIAALDSTHIVAVSAAVESEPWGVTDQPHFANAVAEVATAIPADRFLGALKDIEAAMGRTQGERNGPRVIDLDILLFGDEEWASSELVVPHPRLAERDFVVTPLLAVAPDATWPTGAPITHARASEGRVTGVLGPVPGFEDVTPGSGGSRPNAVADTEGWEAVVSTYAILGLRSAAGPEMLFDAAMLEQAGIDFAWDPFPPGEESLPIPFPRTFRILVRSAQADHARAVLADAHASGAVFEGMPPSGPGYDDDELDDLTAEIEGDGDPSGP